MTEVTAIVLCGGTSRRFGGGDKTTAVIDGDSILGRLVGGLPAHWSVVCVGEERPLARAVTWTREDPPGGGPVAGLAAGLARTTTRYVVLLAGDQPFAGEAAAALLGALAAAATGVDGVRAADAGGEAQPLLAAYRTDALRVVVPPDARDRGVHRTLAPLSCTDMPVMGHVPWDVDTVDDLERARRHAAPGRPLS